MEPFLCILLLAGSLTAYVKGQCSVAEADIVVAVPGKWEVPQVEFDAFEANLIKLFNHFDISPTKINIGLILYGNFSKNIFHPQPYNSRKQVNTRVTIMSQRESYRGEIDRTDDNRQLYGVAAAIYEMRAMLKAPPPNYTDNILRTRARKIGVIFTYGATPTEYERRKIKDQAARAKHGGIVLYALNTNGTDQDVVDIAYDSCRRFSPLSNFSNDLPEAISNLAKGICSELDTTVKVRPGNCFPRAYGYVSKNTVTCEVGGYVNEPDPDNCAYYYTCETVQAKPQHQQCSPGTVYDPLIYNCNHIHNTNCLSGHSCHGIEVPKLIPYPGNCARYIQCDSFRVPSEKDCAAGTFFDFEWQSCNSTECMQNYN